MKLHISKGNTKLGAIPSVSLPPVLSCARGVPCAKGGCYALKLARLRPNVAKNLSENWALLRKDPDLYWDELRGWLKKHQPARFRFHVFGDIPNLTYAAMMEFVARDFPETRFLAFTKRIEFLDAICSPDNLTLVVSGWPGFDIPTEVAKSYPTAWMRDLKNHPHERIPACARECPGSCETCSACWDLEPGGAVVFDKH